MMKQLRFLFTLMVIGGLSFPLSNCRKDIELDNSDKQIPITLSYALNGDSIVLNWDNKRASGFERILVLRSETPIPDGINPTTLFNLKVVVDSDDASLSTFSDRLPVFQPQAYYKVYVKVSGRFIESNAIFVEVNGFFGEGNPISITSHPDSSWLIFVTVVNTTGFAVTKLQVVNYLTKKTLGTATLAGINDPALVSLSTTRYQNQETLLYTYNGQATIYGLPNLGVIQDYNLPYTIWSSIASPTNNFMFFTQYDYVQSTVIRKSVDLSLITNSYDRPNDYYYFRRLAIVDPNDMELIEASQANVYRFRVNPTTGQLISSGSKTVANSSGFNPFLSKIPISHDRQYFIPFPNGFVLDRELNTQFSLPLAAQSVLSDCAFSPNDDFIYMLENTQFFPSVATIRKIAIPSMQEVKSSTFPDILGRKIEVAPNGDLVFLFSDNQTISKYSISTFKF